MPHDRKVPTANQVDDAAQVRAVAYYRHFAQDSADNSVSNQQEKVHQWADDHGIEIVRRMRRRPWHAVAPSGKNGELEGQGPAGNPEAGTIEIC